MEFPQAIYYTDTAVVYRLGPRPTVAQPLYS